MPRLIVVRGTLTASHELAKKEPTTLGSSDENDVVLDDPEVSRRHARIERDGERVFVADLGSRNGTFLNEAKVDRAELRPGDRLRLGQTVAFYLGSDDASRSSPSGRHKVPAARRRDRLANLLVLQEINKALNSETDLPRLLELIMDTAIHLIDAERGFLVLVKEDRLEFVVARNIGYEEVKTPSFKVSNSVIRRVVKTGEPLLTSNAQTDLASIESVVTLDLRSLLCVPLRVKSRTIGTLYMDSRARTTTFDEDAKTLLQAFSDQAAIAIENARLLAEAREKEAILSELRVAQRIQESLLPEHDPAVPGLEIRSVMRTAQEVGGDYYDFVAPSAGDLLVAIGDVSGKGVPAGLIMVMARSILRSLAQARPDLDPLFLAVETNRILKQDLKPGLFMSLLLARWDARAATFRLAGCGHERPLVYRARARRVEPVDLGGLVLGVVSDLTPHVALRDVALEAQDHLLLYTDGLTEARDDAARDYGLDRLTGLVLAHGHLGPRELVETILADVTRHMSGVSQHDDITLISIRRNA